jgi:hypothetical protein
MWQRRQLGIMLFLALVSCAIVLFVTSAVRAEPFLVSDPYPRGKKQPTEFTVVAGALTFSVPAEKLPDGRVRLKFDLKRLPDGQYLLQIKAVNRIRRQQSQTVSVWLLKKNGKEVTLGAPPEARTEKDIPAKDIPAEKKLIPPSRTIPNLLSP